MTTSRHCRSEIGRARLRFFAAFSECTSHPILDPIEENLPSTKTSILLKCLITMQKQTKAMAVDALRIQRNYERLEELAAESEESQMEYVRYSLEKGSINDFNTAVFDLMKEALHAFSLIYQEYKQRPGKKTKIHLAREVVPFVFDKEQISIMESRRDLERNMNGNVDNSDEEEQHDDEDDYMMDNQMSMEMDSDTSSSVN